MMTAIVPFTQDDLHQLYTWIDEIPLSRPKRNIARDFADGCCVAQIVKFFFPKLVQLHNYTPAMSRAKKLNNWNTLNSRVFRKLFFEVPPLQIQDIINAVPGAIQRFLRALRIKIAQIVARREQLMKLAITQDNENVNKKNDEQHGQEQRQDKNDNNIIKKSNNAHGRVNGASNNTASKSPRTTQLTQNRPNSKTLHNTSSSKNRNKNRQNETQSDDDNNDKCLAAPSSQALLNEKDRTILQLRQTIGILSEKIVKLEQLVKVKDSKLNQYRSKFGRFS